MKKVVKIALCVLLIFTVAACGAKTSDTSRDYSSVTDVNDLLAAAKAQETSASEKEEEPAPAPAPSVEEEKEPEVVPEEPEETPETEAEDTEGIDVDLTTRSQTMVYSEVYNMMYYPEDYVGKVIKMEGLYTYLFDESTGNEYHACIVKDATACCSTGIEFVLSDGYEYPSEGDDICVTGTFDTYMEGDHLYCTLRDSVRN